MKISVITAVYNRKKSIIRAIESLEKQSFSGWEHIIVDGSSTDGTQEVVLGLIDSRASLISEPDNGIYDALNKGLKRSSGDIVGVLHSDDRFSSNEVLKFVADVFKDPNIDVLYGDVGFFRTENPCRLVRVYRSNHFHPSKMGWGWMPAHTSMFMRKEVFEKFGLYKTDYKISADFEFVARISRNNSLNLVYKSKILVHMGLGGASTGDLKKTFILNKEVIRACRENGIYTNWLMLLSKYPRKILELSVFSSKKRTV